jgi:squalene-hopene/tetraprenyl-beta-curcumene cyclase
VRELTLTWALAALLSGCSPAPTTAVSWNRPAGAAYLDARAGWWLRWPAAARDHETVCLSCHTTLPYLLWRTGAANPDDAGASPEVERRIVDDVRKRVRLWNDVEPYYGARGGDSAKAAESRGTEAVLNALILARDDARSDTRHPETRTAFDQMWALQRSRGEQAGAWPWLRFGLEPWEGQGSAYYGAALAALAAGTAPDRYAASAAVQGHLTSLRGFLTREYANQPLSNRIVLLWASTELPELMDDGQQASLVDEILRVQHWDGGWSLSVLHHTAGASSLRRMWTKSDGYATGLVAFVLLRLNTHVDDPRLRRAIDWLIRAQDTTEGFWPAESLNMRRPAGSDAARFMVDAASAYAALALDEASSRQVRGGVAGEKTGVAVEHLHVQRASVQEGRVAQHAQR